MIDLTLEQVLGRTVYHYQLLLPIIWRKKKKRSSSLKIQELLVENLKI